MQHFLRFEVVEEGEGEGFVHRLVSEMGAVVRGVDGDVIHVGGQQCLFSAVVLYGDGLLEGEAASDLFVCEEERG